MAARNDRPRGRSITRPQDPSRPSNPERSRIEHHPSSEDNAGDALPACPEVSSRLQGTRHWICESERLVERFVIDFAIPNGRSPLAPSP